MSLSPGLSKQTDSNIRYGPSISLDSPFSLQSVVRDDIPGQKTPDTEVNESFHFSPGGNFPIPSTILYQDDPSPSFELEREPEPEDTPTQLELPAGMVVDTLTCLSNMNIDNNNNNNKRKAETPPSTSKKSSIKYSIPTSCLKSSSGI